MYTFHDKRADSFSEMKAWEIAADTPFFLRDRYEALQENVIFFRPTILMNGGAAAWREKLIIFGYDTRHCDRSSSYYHEIRFLDKDETVGVNYIENLDITIS